MDEHIRRVRPDVLYQKEKSKTIATIRYYKMPTVEQAKKVIAEISDSNLDDWFEPILSRRSWKK